MPATHHDAEVVMKLYELRREEVMRKARCFIALDFWPASAQEIIDISSASGTEQNAYFRQVMSFLEMSVSLPLHGAVNSDLFLEWNGEVVFIFAKFKPFLAELRAKINPGFLGNVEKFINSSPMALDRLEKTSARVAKIAEAKRAGK